MSAADMQLVGWPDPACAVDSREWRRSFCAMRKRVASSTAMEAVVLSVGDGWGAGRLFRGRGTVKRRRSRIVPGGIRMLSRTVLAVTATAPVHRRRLRRDLHRQRDRRPRRHAPRAMASAGPRLAFTARCERPSRRRTSTHGLGHDRVRHRGRRRPHVPAWVSPAPGDPARDHRRLHAAGIAAEHEHGRHQRGAPHRARPVDGGRDDPHRWLQHGARAGPQRRRDLARPRIQDAMDERRRRAASSGPPPRGRPHVGTRPASSSSRTPF